MDTEAANGLRVLLREAFDDELSPLGFERYKRTKVWLRAADGVHHAVSLEGRSGSVQVRWDVISPLVGQILHGVLPEPHDVAYSGVISGTPTPAVQPGVKIRATEAELSRDLNATIAGIKLGVAQVAGWVTDYSSRSVCTDLLLAAKDPDTRHRVAVPGSDQLRLFTAACFAAIDRRSDAQAIVERAIAGSAPWKGALTDERNARLLTALHA